MVHRPTSAAAWKWFLPHSPTLDDMIIAMLVTAGRDGATCEAIETTIGRSHQSVSGNLRHLVEKGRVIESGLYGKTKSGRKAIQWRLPVATARAMLIAAGATT